MSAIGTIWDTIGELIVWAVASANESDGKGQVTIAGDTAAGGQEDRSDTEHCALPGHYSAIEKDDPLLTMRRDDGAVSIGARTVRPTDAVAGERGWTHKDSGLVRVKSGTTDTVFEVKDMQTGIADPVTGILVGGGCSLGSTSGVVLQVVRATDVVVTPLGVAVGACKGTTITTGSV